MGPNILKNQLIDKVKLSLGYPTITLELETAHYSQCVDLAVQSFNRFAYGEGVKNDWLLVQLSANVKDYAVPSSVVNILEPSYPDPALGDTSQLFTFENYMWNIGALNVWQWDSFGLVTYQLAMSYLELIRQMIISKYTVTFSKEESMIHVEPAPASNVILFSPVYSMVPASALYDSEWVYLWAKAEAMEMIGHIRGKYGSIPGPGGNVQFGEDMLRSAADLKHTLWRRLETEYEPPMFFIA